MGFSSLRGEAWGARETGRRQGNVKTQNLRLFILTESCIGHFGSQRADCSRYWHPDHQERPTAQIRQAGDPGLASLVHRRHQYRPRGLATDTATTTKYTRHSTEQGSTESDTGSQWSNTGDEKALAAKRCRVSGDTNSDPLPPVLIPTPIMPSCYRLSTPLSGSFLVFTSVSRWVCSGSTFVNLDRINPLLRFSRSR